jgi:hypothetical protein
MQQSEKDSSPKKFGIIFSSGYKMEFFCASSDWNILFNNFKSYKETSKPKQISFSYSSYSSPNLVDFVLDPANVDFIFLIEK